MNLLVIESSGKEATIKKYLGSEWEVFATKGHVRDLPVKSFGLDAKTFEPNYMVMPDKEAVVKRLKQKVAKAENVFLATDPDREGEAIAWHLAYLLDYDNDKLCRVEFNEITKDVILRSLKNPRKIDLSLVNAQQARRVLDRIVGYKISPILCKKLSQNLSAGRVQSVTLKLVVDREREIQNFKPEEYWNISAELEKENEKPTFKALLSSCKGKKVKIANAEQKDLVVSALNTHSFVVKKVEKKVAKSHAPAPFTTSSMQQDALNKLNMSLKTTTKCAQELYEGVELGSEGKIALVTYIRTDSVRVSEEAQAKAKQFITQKYGVDYVPAKPNIYKTKDSAQDAHEAIRPTHLERTPESIKPFVSSENYRLYKLVYERFLASQMAEAEYNQVNCEVANGDYIFKVTGKTPKFLGFTAIYQEHKEVKDDDEKEAKLPQLEQGDTLKLVNLLPEQKFTKPAPRYTEATLVKAMEENGIGRPATYTPTITILSSRNYVDKEGKALYPTELGFKISDMLEKYFADIMNINFTAQMETKLDEIAAGNKEWHEVINNFYNELLPELKNANLDREPVAKREYEVSDVKCDKCGAMMVIKEGRYGKFLACPNYPKCKNIVSMNAPKVVGICPNCGKNLLERKSKKGTTYYSCEDYKDCKFMSWDLPLSEPCPKCGCYVLLKKGKKDNFKRCSNPDCDYFEKVVQKPEEPVDDGMEPA
ncbi:MAG: type I DNA topoisomerase [Clostridiales bacterium]|nr:type I DNA topoisomerase [Candidatus Apopatousia equi]